MEGIHKAVSLTEYSISEQLFSTLSLEKQLPYEVTDKWEIYKPYWNTAVTALGLEPLRVQMDKEHEDASCLYKKDDLLCLANFSKNEISVSVASVDPEEAARHIDDLRKIYPPAPDATDGKVKVRFWYMTQNGPRTVQRMISIPSWKEIKKNYNLKTVEGLNYLMHDFKPSTGGQLIIWHGVPGTGKSYALRALLSEWKDWCTAEYILDPETLFGGGQAYMADLVLRRSVDEYEPVEVSEDTEDDAKWKLLILEDSGELLTRDAKERAGQGLSRLLNLVDGLIGQGLRVLVLITTNEDFGNLHPAVSREGRCIAAINFRKFSWDQTLKWLDNPDKLPQESEYTLAELFSFLKGKEELTLKSERKIGFQI